MFKRLFKNKKKSIYMNENSEYKSFNIGDYTYGNPKIKRYDSQTSLEIGKFCSIADNVTFLLGGEHRVDWITTYPFNILNKNAKHILGHPKSKGNIIIENDVWIGFGSTILSGVTIGNGAVIGTNSLVTKDIKPYEIVGGNPAKHIKYRFSNEKIEKLLKIEWWNWEMEKIEKNFEYLMSDSDDLFIKAL
jgi:acetyltransferase-like isoleucine patch superfamily enzyme